MKRLARHAGVGLFDALIALAILSFGMLAMTRFQTRLVSSATEAQSRLTATAFADELLNTVLADGVNGGGGAVNCYTIPQVGACTFSAAASRTLDWQTRVLATLPESSASAVVNPAKGQFAVTIQWAGRGTGDTRLIEVSTCINAASCTP